MPMTSGMSYETGETPPAVAPYPPVASAPPMTNFVVGSPGRARGGNGRAIAALAAVAVVGAGAFVGVKALGGDDASAVTAKPKPKAAAPKPKKPALTKDYAVLGEALKNASIAEESFFVDNEKYTRRVAALTGEGAKFGPDVRVSVPRADATGYCVQAAGNGIVASFDSKSGQLRKKAC